jgi:DNA (cytosine-5)-methyltransferase 1
MALEEAGFQIVFANDIEPSKRALYTANFDAGDFRLGDVRQIHGDDVPDVELATASFPCVDLSLAGNRRGLAGVESGMFWEFARVLEEMADRGPATVLLENVPSFASSHGGRDLRDALARLNALGYSCDLFIINARRFVPQSRPRLFIVGIREVADEPSDWTPSDLRPGWIAAFAQRHPELRLHARPLWLGPQSVGTLADLTQRLSARDPRWWEPARVDRFVSSLSSLQAARLSGLSASRRIRCATAYRRTRGGTAVWEIRPDEISGCLRTARGGSSKQALVFAGLGRVKIRWMTPREYARLQGAPDYRLTGVTHNQVLFGLGDAVCVPVVAWIAREYLWPLVGEAAAITSTAA